MHEFHRLWALPGGANGHALPPPPDKPTDYIDNSKPRQTKWNHLIWFDLFPLILNKIYLDFTFKQNVVKIIFKCENPIRQEGGGVFGRLLRKRAPGFTLRESENLYVPFYIPFTFFYTFLHFYFI